ncbi:uncharacterized protein LOC110236530 isoform X2 [Exaiptasia diaphana]|uniref:Uncharacterized protein n=1 Tax=Exaiptasia diaphana TaxID=2652724 RepID=A0A913YGJ1_EXADI|nr:uncharacterized protein LOC110236530 isoform X2 [Exaiptasia diaphana]
MMFCLLLCIFLGLGALTVKGCHTNLKGESGKFSIDKTHNGYRSNCSWTIGKGVNNIDFIVIKFTPFDLGWRCINFGQSYVEVADVNYEAKVRECGGKRPFQVLIKNRPAVVRYYTCCYAKAFFDVSFYIISQKFSGLSAKTLKPALKQTKPGVITIDWDPLKGSNADAWKPVLKQQKPVPSKNYIVVPLYNFTSKREPFLYIIESRNDTSIAVENLKPATSYTFKFIAFDSTNTRGPLIVSSTATVLTRNGTLRLMGGQLSNQGRVEIYKYGWWKKICTWNHNLNNNAASVVCRSLGLSHPTYVLNYRAFYGTSFPMHFVEDFRCTGTETSLEECSSTDPSSRCPYYLRTAAVACGYPPVFHRNISEMSGAITSPGYPWFMMQTDYRWTFTQNMTRGRVALYFEELDLRRYGGSSRVTIQESSSLSFSKTYTSEYRGKPGMVINLPGQLRFYSPYTSNRDNRDGRGMRVRFLVYNEPEGEVPTLNNWKLSLSSNHYTRITANWTQVVFTGYGIIGFVMSCNSSQDWAKEVSYAVGEGNSTSLNCSELIGYTQYNVHVLVQLRMQGKDIYKIYQSLVASLTTPQSFPRSRPPGLTSTEITLNTAIIQWQQIPRKDAHGVLLGYIVDLYSYYSDRYRGEIKTNNTSIAFTDLSPATEYYVRVKGYTAVGSGPNNYYIFYTSSIFCRF